LQRAFGQPVEQFFEGLVAGPVVLGVDRQRRFVGIDRKPPLDEDVAAVDLGRHQVPRDAVRRRALEQRPHRRVQPRVLGQRPVMEVDRAARGQRQDVGAEHRQVGDAHQVVEGLQIARLAQRRDVAQHAHALPRRPAPHRGPGGDDRGNRVPPFAQPFCALDQKRLVADEDEALAGGVRHGAAVRKTTLDCGRPSVAQARRKGVPATNRSAM
jgi:hypothetical protein